MFHDNMTALADKLIPKYGDDITLIKKGNVTYNPNTGDDSSTDTSYPTKGYVSNYVLSDIDDIKVKIDDLRVLVRLDDEVTKDWELLYQGKIWQVIDVTRIRTQNYTITQALQVRANG